MEENQEFEGIEEDIDLIKFIDFKLDDKIFALPLLNVREIVQEPTTIISIPENPDYILGIINLRGNIISVYDLKIQMGIRREEKSKESSIIITEYSDLTVGFLVDEIIQVSSHRECDLKEFEGTGNKSLNRHISSCFIQKNSIIGVLNLKELY